MRNRMYAPVPVDISCEQASNTWSQRNQVKVEFTARKPNYEYQTLYLTQDEADAAAGAVVGAMSAQGRRSLLTTLRLLELEADAIGEVVVGAMSTDGRESLFVKFLKGLTHAKLLRVLAFDLRERVRLPKKRGVKNAHGRGRATFW